MSKIGSLFSLRDNVTVDEQFKRVKDVGGECCQISVWDMKYYTDEKAEELKAASARYGVEISTIWAGWSGPCIWNYTDGPATIGLVPEAYRMKRAEELITAADFAVKAGVSRIATHVGFLPENPCDPNFQGVLSVLRYVAAKCRERGVKFLFETGQETPVTLLRFIEAIGLDNVGINLDTANLIIYGKANTVDALSVFGKYVMDTHIKDALYPTGGMSFGKEVKVGEGRANIPEVVRVLKELGYEGNYVIEREISGDQQTRDIIDTVEYLKKLL